MTARHLTYISNARIPSEKANSIQSMNQCAALAERYRLTFWYARRRDALPEGDIFGYYGTTRNFTLREIPSFDSPALKSISERAGFLLQALSFSFYCTLRLMRDETPVVYTRHSLDVLFAPLVRMCRPGRILIFEDHDGILRSRSALKSRLLNVYDGIAVTSERHKRDLVEKGFPEKDILVAPNGVDLTKYPADEGCLPSDGPCHICYAGNLFVRKGVYTLVDAFRMFPKDSVLHIVGGDPNTIPPFQQYVGSGGNLSDIRIHGHVPPSDVSRFLKQAHVLVLPNSGRDPLSRDFTSPLKLFEYMAAGKPIVASRVPAVQEILEDRRNALLVEPDDPEALAAAICELRNRPDLARRIARNARRTVEQYTWSGRAEKIDRFIRSKMSERA